MDARVCELVTDLGEWDWQAVSHCLNHIILNRIASILPQNEGIGCDQMIWKGTSNGQVTVSSACEVLKGHNWNDTVPIWILTNVEICRRGLNADPSCMRCGNIQEVIIHAVHECPTAKFAWLQIIPATLRNRFFNLDLVEWIVDNLQYNGSNLNSSIGWNVLFAMVCWNNWKDRSTFIIQSKSSSTLALFNRSLTWAEYFASGQSVTGHSRQKEWQQIGWMAPPQNWIKINVGEASFGGCKHSNTAGLLSNDEGGWIRGYCRRIGGYSAIRAELWAIHDGLMITWRDTGRSCLKLIVLWLFI
ncbi:hypothetical protein GOBAR_AA12402 [Gossypium barbadense]|uniref:Reverse transcriptase zinc-binding domain-containing protein n=1 Tax=Gossypium barbadense TaxID=3634 RepID=A0A2P5XY04_GOSBA|nr:hypothetical protein GOBAR_AA12402 [Gossypium barbadense]